MNIYIVKRDAPAFEFIRRELVEGSPLRDGAICLASQEELDSWRTDVEIITLEDQKKSPDEPGI